MDFSVTGANGKIQYDLNGNILFMLQKGVLPGTASPLNVDNLTYAYASLSNKLMRVTDNSTLGTSNGKLGDFVDGTNTGDDYVYDDNGNLVIDLNKNAKELRGVTGANGIRYNFLDKPEEIHITGKGTITIVYDANGNKLQRTYTPQGGSTTTTTYINEFVYQGDVLQYINFEEGRIRVMQAVNSNNGYDILTINGNMDLPGSKRGAYDFFIRDYQSNVRMILTEDTHFGSNSCTMELNRAANEEPLFGQVDANGVPTAANEVKARFAVASIPGQSGGTGWTNSTIGSYVSRIGNLASSKMGPNTLLRVMAGDSISATTIYYYKNPVTNVSGGNNILSSLLNSLLQAISGESVTNSLLKNAASNITTQLNGNTDFQTYTSPDAGSSAGTNPKAYLSVLFFDERFNFVTDGSATLRVQGAGNGTSPLVFTNIKAPKNGYCYIYVSNEANEMVYFDNLQVTQARGRIVEEDHYYAYGLKIAAISSKKLGDVNEGQLKNGYLYNDKELFDDADLNWYDYGFRNYDPQIGRFTQLDPLTDDYPELTPYQFAGCEPIGNVDVDGLEPFNAVKTLETVTVVSHVTKTLEPVTVVSYITKTVAQGSLSVLPFFRFGANLTMAMRFYFWKPVITTPTNSPSGKLFNIQDAEIGLKTVFNEYGKDMASTVEKMYRTETRNFTSSQYRHTGTGGMEAHGPAPYYGWTPSYFSQPPTGIYSIYENKGLSDAGGNTQITIRPKKFVIMPTVTDAMLFKANYIRGHGGNYARWYSTNPQAQALYRKSLEAIKPRIVNSFLKMK